MSFTETEKAIIKLEWNNNKAPQIAKIILSRKNKAKGIILTDFKIIKL
jgi:hypothetical protein